MLQHIAIDHLGSCRNDPTKCSSYCGFGFVATETIDGNLDSVPVLSICGVCKCPAASHIKDVPDHLKAPPKLSPVDVTVSGSEAVSGNIKPTFNSARPEIDVNATKDAIYNSCSSSQISAIISKNGKDMMPPKKRKKTATTTESDSTSGTKQPKKTKASSSQDDDSLTVFMITLVSETSVVWSAKFEHVSTHAFIALRTARFVREVQVPKKATSFVVISLIEDAFKDLIRPGRWCVLRGDSSAERKGHRTKFKPTILVSNNQLDYKALKFSAYNTQPRDVKSGEYLNLVWIARSRGEPDIPVPSVFEPDGDIDDDVSGPSDKHAPTDDPEAGMNGCQGVNSVTQPLFFPPASDSEAAWDCSSIPDGPSEATGTSNLSNSFPFGIAEPDFSHLAPELAGFSNNFDGGIFFNGVSGSHTANFQQFKFEAATSPETFQHNYIHPHDNSHIKSNTSTSPIYTPQVPTPAASTVRSSPAGEVNPAPPAPGAFVDNTFPPTFWRLHRLHTNMAVLSTQHVKWFLTGLSSHPVPIFFKDIKGLQPVLKAHIEKLVALSGDEKSNAINAFLVFLDQLLRDLIQPFIELAVFISASSVVPPEIEKRFDDTFAVGPGGVGMLISFLMDLFRMLGALPKNVSLDASGASAQSLFHGLPSHLMVLLIHLRTKYHRGLWDADGCRDLIYILHSHGDKLPVGTLESNLYACFSQINITDDPLKMEHIKFLLSSAFGSLSDPTQMCHDAICTGQYGLDGFYSSVVVPMLDDIEYDADGYSDLLAILAKLCKGLARKAGNTIKSYKPPSEEKQDKDKVRQASRAGRSQRQTRSSKKGADAPGAMLNSKTGYYRQKKSSEHGHDYETDSPDDMTNTDSLESDYYTKVKPNQPDIKFRRQEALFALTIFKVKPTFTYVPGSSSEDQSKYNWDDFDAISDKYSRLGRKPKKASTSTFSSRHWAAGPPGSAKPKPSARYPGKRAFSASSGRSKKSSGSFPKASSGSTTPKPGSSSKPRPTPISVAKVPPSRIQEAQELANTHKDPDIKWPHFLSGLLNDFGHPDPNCKPRLTDIFKDGIQPTAQWKKIHLVYHVDKNRTQSEEWQQICSVFTPALNLWRERIEGTYVWPKGY
ncbi:uncharacterized protein EV420DRAFT_1721234 [Desarmillaria tabescens]|uniref:Uncharacterized protein n=1 Tax=Armillaria tabescens TaxID=1929756 RepID=A0AA39JND4_ARMTA|nr:uncharacterized protein EV420DRAFT_1721234 [Desarmillaria tabescens]KAK0445050.1 hypothetical protein EV420DRAFT_1721234 [Desarmillaria tabescens]